MPDYKFRFPLEEMQMATDQLHMCERDLPHLRSLLLNAAPSRSANLARDLVKCHNIEKLTLRHEFPHFSEEFYRGYEFPAAALVNLRTLHLDLTHGMHSKPLIDSLSSLTNLHTLLWFTTRLKVLSTNTRTLSVFHVREVMHSCSLSYLYVSVSSRAELEQLREAHEDEDPERSCECVFLVKDD